MLDSPFTSLLKPPDIQNTSRIQSRACRAIHVRDSRRNQVGFGSPSIPIEDRYPSIDLVTTVKEHEAYRAIFTDGTICYGVAIERGEDSQVVSVGREGKMGDMFMAARCSKYSARRFWQVYGEGDVWEVFGMRGRRWQCHAY